MNLKEMNSYIMVCDKKSITAAVCLLYALPLTACTALIA